MQMAGSRAFWTGRAANPEPCRRQPLRGGQHWEQAGRTHGRRGIRSYTEGQAAKHATLGHQGPQPWLLVRWKTSGRCHDIWCTCFNRGLLAVISRRDGMTGTWRLLMAAHSYWTEAVASRGDPLSYVWILCEVPGRIQITPLTPVLTWSSSALLAPCTPPRTRPFLPAPRLSTCRFRISRFKPRRHPGFASIHLPRWQPRDTHSERCPSAPFHTVTPDSPSLRTRCHVSPCLSYSVASTRCFG